MTYGFSPDEPLSKYGFSMNTLNLISRNFLARAAWGASFALGVHVCTDLGSLQVSAQENVPVVSTTEVSRDEVRRFEQSSVETPFTAPIPSTLDSKPFRPFVDSSPILPGTQTEHIEHVNGVSFTTTAVETRRTPRRETMQDLPPIVGPEQGASFTTVPVETRATPRRETMQDLPPIVGPGRGAGFPTTKVNTRQLPQVGQTADLPPIVSPDNFPQHMRPGDMEKPARLGQQSQQSQSQSQSQQSQSLQMGASQFIAPEIVIPEVRTPEIVELPKPEMAVQQNYSHPGPKTLSNPATPVPSAQPYNSAGADRAQRIAETTPAVDNPNTHLRQVAAQGEVTESRGQSLPQVLPELPQLSPTVGNSQPVTNDFNQQGIGQSLAAPGFDGAPSVHDRTINSQSYGSQQFGSQQYGSQQYGSQPYGSGAVGSALPNYDRSNNNRTQQQQQQQQYDSLLSHSYSGNHSAGDINGADCLDYGYGSHSGSPNYLYAEALYFDRGSDFITLSDTFVLEPYDYEIGGRITFGRRSDELSGSEISYVGPFEWEDNQIRRSATNSLNSAFIAGTGIVPANFSAFNNARYHQQSIDSNLNSLEYNRTWFGWDIMQFTLGGRYVRLEDKYQFVSVNGAGQRGSYNLNTLNNLVGPQAGVEIFYDTGKRLSYSLRGKFGLMANLYEGESRFNNNGFLVANSDKENIDLSGLFEFGATAHYQLGPSFRLRAGYEAWALNDVATADRNVISTISRSSGRSVSNNDNVIVHGLSGGLELFW